MGQFTWCQTIHICISRAVWFWTSASVYSYPLFYPSHAIATQEYRKHEAFGEQSFSINLQSISHWSIHNLLDKAHCHETPDVHHCYSIFQLYLKIAEKNNNLLLMKSCANSLSVLMKMKLKNESECNILNILAKTLLIILGYLYNLEFIFQNSQ